MLDLNSCIHFKEIKVFILVCNELYRACRAVVHRRRQSHRLGTHGGACLGIEQRRGRLLDDLLVAPLDRAFALAQVDHLAVTVGQHLDLDVARLLDELLDEDALVAESGARLVARRGETLAGLAVVAGDAHALAAAAGRGLDHDRIADPGGDTRRLIRIGNQLHVSGHDADPGLGGQALGLDLVAHGLDRALAGSDEDHARRLQRRDEGRVLGQEAEARMHALRAGLLAGGDDLVDCQIALYRGCRSDGHRLVGQFHVQRARVGLGIDRDGRNAHALGAADHAAGDLAAVGDEDLGEHLA
jgi:hypothetical protein